MSILNEIIVYPIEYITIIISINLTTTIRILKLNAYLREKLITKCRWIKYVSWVEKKYNKNLAPEPSLIIVVIAVIDVIAVIAVAVIAVIAVIAIIAVIIVIVSIVAIAVIANSINLRDYVIFLQWTRLIYRTII